MIDGQADGRQGGQVEAGNICGPARDYLIVNGAGCGRQAADLDAPFLAKPFRPATLVEKVQEVLGGGDAVS